MKRRLAVDPILCKAHGMCAELFPERVRLDDWGYPIIDLRSVTDDLQRLAERAIAECPRGALRLVTMDDPAARRRAEEPTE